MTNPTDNKRTVSCPYPGCGADIRIAATLPAGDYLCRCHSCTLRLRWATTVNYQRTPYVEVVPNEDKTK